MPQAAPLEPQKRAGDRSGSAGPGREISLGLKCQSERVRRSRSRPQLWPVLLAFSGHLLLTSCGSGEVADRRTPVPWHLDPEVGAPAPEAQDLHVVVSDTRCASGRSAEEHVSREPKVDYGDAVVIVTFDVSPLSGDQTCQGNPSAKRTVRLKQPIGARRVLDGATHQERHPTDVQPRR